MTFKKIVDAIMKRNTTLFLNFTSIILIIGLCFFLYEKSLTYTLIFFVFILIILIIALFKYLQNIFSFYDKTILSILQNDFSADFSKHQFHPNYNSLIKLYDSLKSKQHLQISKDIVYGSILNTIESGILILQKDGDDWTIFLMNDYFSKHFKVPKVSKWSYLRNQLPSLCGIIEMQNFEEIKTSLEIRVDAQDTQTFVMQSSICKNQDQHYYIVLLDSIQKVIEKKEKEAWINLMKVISHELLNSITPIRSLSQNLQELVLQESLSKEDLIDMKLSVSTMINRSDHLQQFVESYRKLAMLPSPKKEKTALKQLIFDSLQIMAPLYKKENIEVINSVTLNILLHIDKNQMEQVMINLLTNSIYAMSGNQEKQINIAAVEKEKRIFITISDSGAGIDAEIEDKIFLPFFTTRKEGAGVGLTLSKSIVEAHGGYLYYKIENEKTSFTICLVE